MTFPAGQNGVATSGLSLDASPSYGVAAGVRLNEEDLVESAGQDRTRMSIWQVRVKGRS